MPAGRRSDAGAASARRADAECRPSSPATRGRRPDTGGGEKRGRGQQGDLADEGRQHVWPGHPGGVAAVRNVDAATRTARSARDRLRPALAGADRCRRSTRPPPRPRRYHRRRRRDQSYRSRMALRTSCSGGTVAAYDRSTRRLRWVPRHTRLQQAAPGPSPPRPDGPRRIALMTRLTAPTTTWAVKEVAGGHDGGEAPQLPGAVQCGVARPAAGPRRGQLLHRLTPLLDAPPRSTSTRSGRADELGRWGGRPRRRLRGG